jgi:hypothetical protein
MAYLTSLSRRVVSYQKLLPTLLDFHPSVEVAVYYDLPEELHMTNLALADHLAKNLSLHREGLSSIFLAGLQEDYQTYCGLPVFSHEWFRLYQG